VENERFERTGWKCRIENISSILSRFQGGRVGESNSRTFIRTADYHRIVLRPGQLVRYTWEKFVIVIRLKFWNKIIFLFETFFGNLKIHIIIPRFKTAIKLFRQFLCGSSDFELTITWFFLVIWSNELKLKNERKCLIYLACFEKNVTQDLTNQTRTNLKTLVENMIAESLLRNETKWIMIR
jgi:hypothetical protein